jgi:hypothetical protein
MDLKPLSDRINTPERTCGVRGSQIRRLLGKLSGKPQIFAPGLGEERGR